MSTPAPLSGALPPEAEHRGLRERERDEHVDRVHRDELRDVAARVEERRDRRGAHEQHAILHREPIGELAEAVRHVEIFEFLFETLGRTAAYKARGGNHGIAQDS